MNTHSEPDQAAAGADAEHWVQMGLAQALCDAVLVYQNNALATETLDQLVAYSEVHFMSEQLLMRLSSYPDFDDHVLDHERMMEWLATVKRQHEAGEPAMVWREAEALRTFLAQHIATRDQRFNDYYRAWSERADPNTLSS